MSVSYAETATVITETLRLRKEPTTDSNILRNLDAGDKLEVISKEGDWYKISFDGYEGYVAAEYLRLDQDVPSTTDENNQTSDSNTAENTNDDGGIKLKANSTLSGKFLKVDLYSSIDNILGTQYIEIGNVNENQEKEIETYFKISEVKSYQITVVDEAGESTVGFMDTAMTALSVLILTLKVLFI